MAQALGPLRKKAQLLQNIKVVVRVRPLNEQELECKVKSVVHCTSNKEIFTKDKKYQFDRVFKPENSQMDIYLYVVAPMISDVLSGYNCTVFAYGQTGTGKTYTMTGGDRSSTLAHWKDDPLAGCIPRAAANIFDEITTMGNTFEYNVRVSFLELYNEEVHDLLSEDDKSPTLNIFNDPKGSVYIHGLKEITVMDRNDIYQLLDRGNRKRQTAATLMNHQSSRSHTVFTITVHTRESTLTGEDVLKTGKINLVDLAGSENAAKSGAKDARAIELANINKSLLTLGRVIHILAEKSKHVPYRDSKLTRILQDSLGGHTKTCIVATVSPAHTSYEETVSTLEYASRARDIKNNPTVNEKITKVQMMKDMTKEIEKLKKDLQAARSGEGFFVFKENWDELTQKVKCSSSVINEKNEIIREKSKRLNELELWKDSKVKDFEEIMKECKIKKKQLDKAKVLLKEHKINLKQEQFVSNIYENVASKTMSDAKELLEIIEMLRRDRAVLQQKLENQYYISLKNENFVREKMHNTSDNLENIKAQERQYLKSVENKISSIVESVKPKNGLTTGEATELYGSLTEQFNMLKSDIEATKKVVQQRVDTIKEDVNSRFEDYCENFACTSIKTVEEFERTIKFLLNIKQHLASEIELDEEQVSIMQRRIKKNKSLMSAMNKFEEDQLKAYISTVNIHEGREKSLQAIDQIETQFESATDELTKHLHRHCEGIAHTEDIAMKYSRQLEKNYNEVITNIKEQVHTDLASLQECGHQHSDVVNDLIIKTEENLLIDIISAERSGDTPKSDVASYRKKVIDEAPPRDILIKRFKEQFDEDKENCSFCLNVSTDSIKQIDDTLSDVDLDDKVDESKNQSSSLT